jgi:hypothetical protein
MGYYKTDRRKGVTLGVNVLPKLAGIWRCYQHGINPLLRVTLGWLYPSDIGPEKVL